MKVDYHRWFSETLNRNMELKIYGESGRSILVFPSSGGRFFDFENQGMVNSIAHFIDQGKVRVIAVDSIDGDSWLNRNISPHDRACRHELYDCYIVEEVVPFINQLPNGNRGIITSGASMGGFHAANFFFRHPDLFSGVFAMSGLYSVKDFVGNYMDETVYFNSPLDYLKNITDPWYLTRYRNSDIIFCVGQGLWEDRMVEDTRLMQSILKEKGIDHFIDYWGHDVNHDWYWWLKQFPYFIKRLI